MNMLTVKDLVNNMVTWQQNRYLDPGVWSHFKSKINPAALPTDISSLQLPAPPNAPHPLQLAFMVSTQVQLPGHLTDPYLLKLAFMVSTQLSDPLTVPYLLKLAFMVST